MLSEAHKQRKLELQNIRRFKAKHGVTPEDYNLLNLKQKCQCKLCKGLPKDKFKAIDSKLFCDNCYTIVKAIKNNPSIINRLKSFIEEEVT